MIEDGVIEMIVLLPAKLFLNTHISVCIWFLKKDKSKSNEILFIDARNLGTMETRVLKVLKTDDIQKIEKIVSSWRNGIDYEDITGFCKSSKNVEIKNNSYVLTPGSYVGFAEEQDDEFSFEKKMRELSDKLNQISEENLDLDKKIKSNLKKIGF